MKVTDLQIMYNISWDIAVWILIVICCNSHIVIETFSLNFRRQWVLWQCESWKIPSWWTTKDSCSHCHKWQHSRGIYLALLNRAGGLYVRIVTEVVSTDWTQWDLYTRPRYQSNNRCTSLSIFHLSETFYLLFAVFEFCNQDCVKHNCTTLENDIQCTLFKLGWNLNDMVHAM